MFFLLGFISAVWVWKKKLKFLSNLNLFFWLHLDNKKGSGSFFGLLNMFVLSWFGSSKLKRHLNTFWTIVKKKKIPAQKHRNKEKDRYFNTSSFKKAGRKPFMLVRIFNQSASERWIHRGKVEICSALDISLSQTKAERKSWKPVWQQKRTQAEVSLADLTGKMSRAA